MIRGSARSHASICAAQTSQQCTEQQQSRPQQQTCDQWPTIKHKSNKQQTVHPQSIKKKKKKKKKARPHSVIDPRFLCSGADVRARGIPNESVHGSSYCCIRHAVIKEPIFVGKSCGRRQLALVKRKKAVLRETRESLKRAHANNTQTHTDTNNQTHKYKQTALALRTPTHKHNTRNTTHTVKNTLKKGTTGTSTHLHTQIQQSECKSRTASNSASRDACSGDAADAGALE